MAKNPASVEVMGGQLVEERDGLGTLVLRQRLVGTCNLMQQLNEVACRWVFAGNCISHYQTNHQASNVYLIV